MTAERERPASADGFQIDVGGLLWQVPSPMGSIYALREFVYFEVPKGRKLELWLAAKYFGVPGEASTAPATIRIVGNSVVCEGRSGCICIYGVGTDGAEVVSRKAIRAGDNRFSLATQNLTDTRVCLELVGRGSFNIKKFVVRVRAISSVGPRQMTSNPLLDLVRDDFRKAQKAGAELPSVPGDSILTYTDS